MFVAIAILGFIEGFFLLATGEFKKQILNLFHIQGLQLYCVLWRLLGEGKGKSCLEFKSISGALTVSAVMGRFMAFCPVYLDFMGPCLKAVTGMGKNTYRRNLCSLTILAFPPKILCEFVFISFELQEFGIMPFFCGLRMQAGQKLVSKIVSHSWYFISCLQKQVLSSTPFNT